MLTGRLDCTTKQVSRGVLVKAGKARLRRKEVKNAVKRKRLQIQVSSFGRKIGPHRKAGV